MVKHNRNIGVSCYKGVIFLNVKERKVPIIIQKEEALLRRLLATHQKWASIYDHLEKARAGYRGELQTDYYLGMLPYKDYYIFQDLRLTIGKFSFQLDTLILSPHFLLIVESKNISGSLLFDRSSKQLIRTKEGKEDGFLDPLAQVNHQCRHLKRWLEHHKIKSCPIESLIVISSPSTILKTTPGHQSIFQKVTHAVHLVDKIKELEHRYPDPALTPYLLQKLSKLFLQSHSPLEVNVLKHYGIHPKDLIKGVICPSCSSVPMLRKYNHWYCPICNLKCDQAHIQAIEDYFHLISPKITNKKCREFLILSSRHTATRLLESMDLPYAGHTKGRIYYQPTE